MDVVFYLLKEAGGGAEKVWVSEIWTLALPQLLMSSRVTGGTPHPSALRHPPQATRNLDLIFSFPSGLDSLFCLWCIYFAYSFFFSSHFSNGEGKAGVITSKKTAPSRVFQRHADVEHGSLKTTWVGTWVLCGSWSLQLPAVLLKRALPVVSILMGTEMNFWKIKSLQRKKTPKQKP